MKGEDAGNLRVVPADSLSGPVGGGTVKQQDQAPDAVKAHEVEALPAIETGTKEVGAASSQRAGTAGSVEAVIVGDLKRSLQEVVKVLL